MEHGRLPAGCPKVFFVAAICVPQMRGSVRGEQCLERGKTYVGNGKNQRWKIRKPTLEIPVSSVGFGEGNGERHRELLAKGSAAVRVINSTGTSPHALR